MNIKSHGGRVAFTFFHSFHSSHETQIQDGCGKAWRQSFDPVPIKLAKSDWIYLGSQSFFRKSLYFYVSFCNLLFISFTYNASVTSSSWCSKTSFTSFFLQTDEIDGINNIILMILSPGFIQHQFRLFHLWKKNILTVQS